MRTGLLWSSHIGYERSLIQQISNSVPAIYIMKRTNSTLWLSVNNHIYSASHLYYLSCLLFFNWTKNVLIKIQANELFWFWLPWNILAGVNLSAINVIVVFDWQYTHHFWCLYTWDTKMSGQYLMFMQQQIEYFVWSYVLPPFTNMN